MKERRLMRGTFMLDDDARFEGWTFQERWNGWACPYFELAEARRIAGHVSWINEGSDTWTFDETTGIFYADEAESDDEVSVWEPELVEGRSLYALGAGWWTWRMVNGRRHVVEPETDERVGCFWEPDEDGSCSSVRDLLREVEEGLGLDLSAARDLWTKAGAPHVREDTGVVEVVVKTALLFGFDVYDSDTRTWVYPIRTSCASCATGECERAAQLNLYEA